MEGVRIVRTIEDAEDAFKRLEAPPMLAKAVKRFLMDRDTTLIWAFMRRRRSTVNG